MPTREKESQGQSNRQGFLRRPHFAVAIQGGLLSVRVHAESEPLHAGVTAPAVGSRQVDETRRAP